MSSPSTLESTQMSSPSTLESTQMSSPSTLESTQMSSPSTLESTQMSSPSTLESTQMSSPSTLESTQMSSPSTLESTQMSSPSTLESTQMSSPSTLESTQMSSPSTLESTQMSSPSTLESTQMSSPSTLESTQMSSPSTLESTQMSSPSTLPLLLSPALFPSLPSRLVKIVRDGPAVVPLEELGAGVRKYEGWCRYTQPPNAWQSWGIPILIALFALLLVLLVLLAAWIQRAQFFQTQQHMAEADRLRKEAEDAEASKSMFVACMSHELRTPMTGIIGMLHALADMTLQPLDLSDPTCPYHVLLAPCSLLPSSLSPTRHARCFGRCYAPSFMHPSLSPTPPPGMLDALADMALQPPDLSDLLIARGCATDTLHLVNRVLDLAKLEAGRAVVDEAVTDVRQWLHGALHRHAEEARSKGIECRAVGDEMVVDVREWLHAALDRHVEAARSKGIECEWLFEISFQTQALVAGD
ncbi:unnamed protein product [Closterium sp. NIES-65]|nr:unnamed protein product [Closterium sp. NIES-65]